MRIGSVGDDLLAGVGEDDVVGSGDDLTVALLLAAVVIVFVLHFVGEAVRIFGCLHVVENETSQVIDADQ